MSKTDYYQLLGVERDAENDVLKKAYRKLAVKYHPDKNPGDTTAEAKFKEVSEAYDVLKDPEKRAAYDRYGHDAFTSGGMGRAGGAGGGGEGFGTPVEIMNPSTAPMDSPNEALNMADQIQQDQLDTFLGQFYANMGSN